MAAECTYWLGLVILPDIAEFATRRNRDAAPGGERAATERDPSIANLIVKVTP
jgi:hypothetical protein